MRSKYFIVTCNQNCDFNHFFIYPLFIIYSINDLKLFLFAFYLFILFLHIIKCRKNYFLLKLMGKCKEKVSNRLLDREFFLVKCYQNVWYTTDIAAHVFFTKKFGKKYKTLK